MRDADHVLIATPEYNASIPGQLKNTPEPPSPTTTPRVTQSCTGASPHWSTTSGARHGPSTRNPFASRAVGRSLRGDAVHYGA
ncbi:NAD(P)H-dependent oxidoreductase [Streptomyces noursei]|uniref:NAD(P)H-dependent oxidoreductase n=1 Tax=Streptomyces noursei TaxID=1971 RepID=UPI001E41133D|nr:NAD(P)H-dependent oxidoreductase [Streptomyces noursei]MCZ1021044.1 NAD(P)H-dependent oxidoreductase [Streptomyces noursei]